MAYLFISLFLIPNNERSEEKGHNIRDKILTRGIPVRFSSSVSRCLPSRRSSNRSLTTDSEWGASRALTHFVNVFFCISSLSPTPQYNHQLFSPPFKFSISYFRYIYDEFKSSEPQRHSVKIYASAVIAFSTCTHMTSTFENLFSNTQSHGEYLCKVSLKSLH